MIKRKMLALFAGALTTSQILLAQVAVPPRHDVPKGQAAGAISYRRDVLPMFRTTCAMCHQDLVSMGALDLTAQSPAVALVNMPSSESPLMRIAPGKPEDSYLMRKVEGTHVAAQGTGLPMPIGQAPMSKSELAMLRQWISQGAADN